MDMNNFYKRFMPDTHDENGMLTGIDLTIPDNYNFGYDVIDEIARLDPDRRALVWVHEDGEEHTFTYSELSKKSNQTANMLLAHGVKKGDKVLSVLKRHYQFWFLTIALCKIGAVLIPATNQLMKKDYTYRFNAADVKYVVATADGEVADHIEEAIAEYGKIEEKYIARGDREGWISFDKEIEKFPDTMERIENKATDDMLLYFTSGTTGYPKMVLHSHYYAIGHIHTAKHWHNLTADDLHFTISESGWGKCMWGKMYGQFTCAAAIFVYDFTRFKSADILQKIQDYKITSLCAPPTMFRMFIKEGIEGYDLSGLRYSTIAGEALNPEVYNRWLEYTGLKLMEGFGQTETAIIVGNLPGMEPKPGSMGKPTFLYNVDIVDGDGNSLPAGETGEIVIRTNGRGNQVGMLKEYYKNPEEMDNSWSNNMYHTGDTAWRDEDGYYWYVGRTDDVIKSSGYRIGPFEIESVLMEHPAVLEVAVTGAKDPLRGMVVKATIVLTKNYKDKGDEALVKELQEHVKKNTAPYKYPRIIEFVDELPKTISGKIRRVAIRDNDNK